jgi:SAM-dependent methyltransferase
MSGLRTLPILEDDVNFASDLLAPVLPHDGMTFDQLRRSYNFENLSNRGLPFTRLIIDSCRGRGAPVRALDVGCGKGIDLSADYQWAVREHVDEYWGIEPDPEISPPPGLFDTHLNLMLEEAALPEGHFDVAYSFMVMEHVTDPESFMRALFRCLKPGGVYVFATPNRRHYFARIASLLRRLRLDEVVLRLIWEEAASDWHYPVQYKFNTESQIQRIAQRAGFDPPQFVYLEDRGPVDYFPKPLRFIYHALRLKRRVIRNPASLMTMVGRISKPAPAI